MPVDINFIVGGEAGQGVQSVGFLLAKTLARGGYYVFADQDYESRIRGGHNFFRVRARDTEVSAIAEPVNILLTLNKESIDLHRDELAPGGVIIFDGEQIKDAGDSSNLFSVPLERLAEEKAGGKLMSNTVSLGAALGLVKYDFEVLSKVLQEHFGSEKIGKDNVKAARAGYEYARQNFQGDFDFHLKPVSDARRMLLTGNEAIALGAIAAGCKFMAAYPMTPTTSIMEYIAAKAKDMGMVMVHAEDEIAAVNMAIGASYAGVRAMTATSGSGFCLMVEGVGLAGITETPLVVINGQRPGPATGLPTRTEQGDLDFVLHASHGEFPRTILAPATVEGCFWSTVKAFNLAEKYQVPAFILTDHVLATSYTTIDPFDLSGVTIDRGLLFNKKASREYKRHAITKSGVSPRAFPGQPGIVVSTDADEHDESGHMIEDAETRIRMVQKRMRKLDGLKKEITPPELYGPRKAETTLIGWGSTGGALREAVDILRHEKVSVNLLHFNELWPFPAEAFADALKKSGSSYVIENNATGQLARLIRAETGIKVSGKILKYDGRPFTPAYIARAIIEGGSSIGKDS
ncbi:MAG: 2-oxoacid:acceptor oxidoreductase subunit alpha [Dehalococcoidales bacterium]|nr:2-oxoacid:acceptor oxidoreductase subunit alpha [Dehalococcoidales bacterium]